MLSVVMFFILITIGYFCGSICSAIIVSRMFSLPNPCAEGSKNPGATNVLRLAGKKYAAIVLLGDMLKGLVPVLLAQVLGANPTIVGFTCLAAVAGHMYPYFFDFKGGKGVATAFGAFLGLNFIMGVVIIALWLLVANFTRYSSLASIVSMIAAPLIAIVITGTPDTFPPLLLITILILYQHRKNIGRLLDGTEPKIELKRHVLDDVTGALLQDRPIDPPEPEPSELKTTVVAKKSEVTIKPKTKSTATHATAKAVTTIKAVKSTRTAKPAKSGKKTAHTDAKPKTDSEKKA